MHYPAHRQASMDTPAHAFQASGAPVGAGAHPPVTLPIRIAAAISCSSSMRTSATLCPAPPTMAPKLSPYADAPMLQRWRNNRDQLGSARAVILHKCKIKWTEI